MKYIYIFHILLFTISITWLLHTVIDQYWISASILNHYCKDDWEIFQIQCDFYVYTFTELICTISFQANVYIHITSYHFNHNIHSYDCFSYNHRNVCIHIAFNNCIISLSHKEMHAVHQIKYDSHTLVLTVYVYISSYYNNMIYI